MKNAMLAKIEGNRAGIQDSSNRLQEMVGQIKDRLAAEEYPQTLMYILGGLLPDIRDIDATYKQIQALNHENDMLERFLEIES